MQQVRHCHVSEFLRGLNLTSCLQQNYTLTSAGGVWSLSCLRCRSGQGETSDQTQELWSHSVSFICSSTCSCESSLCAEAQADLFSPQDSLTRGFSSCSSASRVTWCSLWKSSTDFKAAGRLGWGQRMSKTTQQVFSTDQQLLLFSSMTSTGVATSRISLVNQLN